MTRIAPIECEHKSIKQKSDSQECNACGVIFVYCHGCSKAADADKPIYHIAPVCETNDVSDSLRNLQSQLDKLRQYLHDLPSKIQSRKPGGTHNASFRSGWQKACDELSIVIQEMEAYEEQSE